MKNELLHVEGLHASTEQEGKEILKGVDLTIRAGEVHVLMGPNGSGKSTFANVLMGNPEYEVTAGTMTFEGEDLLELSTDKRARAGLFLSFQTPMEVSGVTVDNFIRTAKSHREGKNIPVLKFRKELKSQMDMLSMKHEYADRYLNEGFSGGEMKKNEILQMLMLNPKLAILDETDSGLDVDATRVVSEGIRRFLNEDNAVLIITHHRELLKSIEPDYVHIIMNGKIVKEGGGELVDEIEEHGFASLGSEVK